MCHWNVEHCKRLIVESLNTKEFGLNSNAATEMSINPSPHHSYRLLLNARRC